MKRRFVIIDAGHGGEDPGAIGYGVKESDLNLQLANRIQQQLINYYTVLKTRSTYETSIPLTDRVRLIKSLKPDLVISIHHNGHTLSTAHGVETYYKFNSPDPVVNKRSRDLAIEIQNNIIKVGYDPGKYLYHDRGVHYKPLYLLNNSPVPSILLEAGFITNSVELAWLRSPKGQISIAYSVSAAIINFFNRLDLNIAQEDER